MAYSSSVPSAAATLTDPSRSPRPCLEAVCRPPSLCSWELHQEDLRHPAPCEARQALGPGPDPGPVHASASRLHSDPSSSAAASVSWSSVAVVGVAFACGGGGAAAAVACQQAFSAVAA